MPTHNNVHHDSRPIGTADRVYLDADASLQ